MSDQNVLIGRILECLRPLANRVKSHAPSALVQVSDHVVAGRPVVYASFLASADSETLDLCVELRSAGGTTRLAADLVRGGSGQVLSEATIEFETASGLDAAIARLQQYVDDQETTIVNDLRAS